jgi:hypothetical protein
MSRYLECALCGVEGPQVRVALVEWADAVTERFSSLPRCSDVADCRQRVEQQGDIWPLAEVRLPPSITAALERTIKP